MSRERMKNNWYVILVAFLFIVQVIVMTAWGERSFVAVHDNLDLFVAHNTMLKRGGLFFAQSASAPMLGGVSRDTLGSEFTLYNLLYVFLPPYGAYVTAWLLKMLIGFWGSILLAREVYGEKYGDYRGLVWLVAAGFCMIPVFPAYGIAFTSVPLVVLLLKRIVQQPRLLWYILLFCYPILSYFSYFGFFLLAYLVCGVIILWIKNKTFPLSLAATVPVLALGYMTWEYRLFREMLFSDRVTIRSTMVNADASLGAVLDKIVEGLITPVFHAQDSHGYWIIWVCLVVILAVNMNHVRKGEKKKIYTEPVNLIFFFILFNCLIYGIYDFKPFRDLFETILPPLTGFQFNRTIYFNPFLWYVLFFLCLKKIWEGNRRGKGVACVLALVGTLVCMLMPQVYNDFYSNCYHHAYEILKGKESSQLSFGEFYSEELFNEIKEELSYQGEWSAAYGMHPAILQYNGISTLDGYLGMYSQEYKEKFRQVIAPALEKSEEFRRLYDTWGARAYLYSGSGENTYQPIRQLELWDKNLYIDTKAFRALEGKYIFSRIPVANANELGLELIKEFSNESSPYTIYVYEAM
ncbi:MAG: DUF6044 family protein [Lachnospiraceae bacterium]|nr:DUF6044 family protein [Lachnospiraceae bacterium]